MKAMIHLTERAAEAIRHAMKQAGAPAVALSLRKGGCAGQEHVMEPAGPSHARWSRAERDGAVVLVDPLAEIFLVGVEIDHQQTMLEEGFVFRNPNAGDSCGCGRSVRFDIAGQQRP